MWPDDETLLERAQQHVAMGELLVAKQKSIVERLRLNGHRFSDAQHLLSTFKETLLLMRKHLAHEQAEAH